MLTDSTTFRIPTKQPVTKTGFQTNQISDDLVYAFLSSVYAISGSFDGDAVTVRARAGKANGHASVLLRQLSQHLPSATDEVTVIPGVHDQSVLNDIILLQMTSLGPGNKDIFIKLKCFNNTVLSYQVFYEDLQLFLGEPYGLLFTHDGNTLLFRLVWRGEDDPCSGSVSHATDISSTSAYQELVVLGFGLKLHWEVADLLVGKQEMNLLLNLLINDF